jgi:hypothetical protein
VEAVSVFGEECRIKLAGQGDREAAIRSPLESMLRTVAERMGVSAVFHDEVRDASRRVRPDYGVSIGGAISGHVEVKAPGRHLDPARFTGHDKRQWERLRDLSNLLYTNGIEWRLYQDGELRPGPVVLSGENLATAGRDLSPPVSLESLLSRFLRWKPQPITTVGALVRPMARLTRLLRGEVLDQLAAEVKAVAAGADPHRQPFTGLATDWRALLFPQASDLEFADGYAQTVTFALLLARVENIELVDRPLHEIGDALGHKHSLMGKALQLLTDDVAACFRGTLDMLVGVIGATDWPKVRRGRRDAYLHLYEPFLELYDDERRKKSGSYYTPHEIVEAMVRLTEEALIHQLDIPRGFRDPDVLTIDPAMGTGTYLHTILQRVARATARDNGPGAVAGVVSRVAERIVGFESQICPYAVAELRAADLLAVYGAEPPASGMRLYVADALDDPYVEQTQISYALQPIAEHHRQANGFKEKANATVIIGNPPYKQLTAGGGGWVENGSGAHGHAATGILEDFCTDDAGRFKTKLKNLYVYFWRWATWKVWESTIPQPDGDAGIVCFISPSSYLTGSAFAKMREYLRRHASEGWIIDLTPEGQTPDVRTRVFPGVRQPLAIALFVRKPDASDQFAAAIRYRAVSGHREEKFAALTTIGLDSDGWREVRSGWTEPFTPAAIGQWDDYPALSDLMTWYSPGVFPTRTWVYSPSADTLIERWRALLAETDHAKQAVLFKEGRDARMDKAKPPLPGTDAHRSYSGPLRQDRVTQPSPVPVGYRSFDRQWVLPDNRLMDMARPDLWAARIPGQVFVVEQHTQVIRDGPGVVFSALIPDFHHFDNRGGRTLPFLHPDGTANLAPGLIRALSSALGGEVSDAEVLAYIAAIVAHPAYTRTFADELHTPGIRVPVTGDPELWAQATQIGEQVIWLHTYGAAFAGPGRPAEDVRFPDTHPARPLCGKAITSPPVVMSYDEGGMAVVIGDGEFTPVRREVWEYKVGGRNVLRSWFNYRKKNPGGRKSPLDRVVPTRWDPDWTIELIDLLSVLTRLVTFEPTQAALLSRVLAGKLLSISEFREGGTRWPQTRKDRKPRFSYTSIRPTERQLTLSM